MQRLPNHLDPWWEELRNLHLQPDHHNLLREIMLHLEALEETLSSSPAIAPSGAAAIGNHTGSATYFLARAEPSGVEVIMGTVTFHAPNSPWTLGDELASLRDGSYRLLTHTTSESPLPSGATPSTPEAQPDGPFASTAEASE